ncbi:MULTISPECIES: MFS transporter [Citrobacter]|uniref:Rhamnogalacturonide transporter RhiT n=1 Tax=Citrobacter europaeus TaxID=1914243 RepID=A0ABY0JVX5_9ENTR|nr:MULTISPECIES: MFS transporter [Citrobacter]MDM3270518.1 MFS transporter [Citrobacter sp. Ce129]SBW28480.1 Rhamnogalacturonide transporter RhiT [Citrobacter europaeus]
MVKPTERRVSYGVAIGYGITDLFGGGAFAIIGTWLLFFYTTYCGLSVLEAGSIFAIARVIDAVLSPIMGYITDNFGDTWLGRRFGRRRFFLLLSSPLMFLYALLWLTDMGYWYYLGTYLSIELLSAMVLVPWETLAAEMTNRYEERSRLSGVRMICSQLGGFLAVSVPGILMQFTGKDNPFTYTLTGLIFSVVFCIAVFITWRCTWEAKDVQEETFQADLQRNSGILNHLKYLILDLFSSFRIRAFRLHIIIYIFSFTAMDVFGSVFTYYVVYCLSQDAASVSGWLSIAAFASVFGTYGFMLLLNKLNITPSAALRLSYTCIFSVLVFLFVIYYTETQVSNILFSAIFILLGMARSGLYYIPWNIYSFIPDIDEMVTQQRREGIFAGVMVLTRKSTVAIAILLIGMVLEESGFVKGSGAQPESALHAIIGLMIFATAALLAVSFYATYKFKLTRETHKILLKEIARRKLGGNYRDCDEETRGVIKQLTGYEYDEVWGGSATQRATGRVSLSDAE